MAPAGSALADRSVTTKLAGFYKPDADARPKVPGGRGGGRQSAPRHQATPPLCLRRPNRKNRKLCYCLMNGHTVRCWRMVFRSVRHRGLRQLLEHDNSRFLRAGLVGRVRNVLTVLALADDLDAFLADAPRGWRVHRLSGNRQQEWSVSVSRNWRITFEEEDGRIDGLNLEDYH